MPLTRRQGSAKMKNNILVVNAGSSSIKFAVWPIGGTDKAALLKGQISSLGHLPHFKAFSAAGNTLADFAWKQTDLSRETLFRRLTAWIAEHTAGATLAAAGHRVVHGGTRFNAPVLITDAVMDDLERLIPLAPLHQPDNLAAIRALQSGHPDLPQVACFDTAFHNGHADVATRMALPRALCDAGIRRYGFHGLSYESIIRALRRLAPALAHGRIVVAHLGSGVSLCAVRDGVSIDSTMGFTTLDGMPMGTRCGSIDAGALLFLMGQGTSPEKMRHILYHESGLLGASGGISDDMRDLLASDRAEAAQAIDLFLYRAVREVAAMAACMGGIDALIFTAGIGENSPVIRERICHGCEWLGIKLDPRANQRGEGCITIQGSNPSAWVIPTNEEQMIALHTVETLKLAARTNRKQLENV
jgi:acetate kinase